MAPRDDFNFLLGSSYGDRDLSLTGEEISIGNFVFRLAKEEMKKKGNYSFETKVVLAKENLSKIQDLFDKCEDSMSLFLGNFGLWKACRVDAINRLREIVAIMNKERFNCNVSKITGVCVSIAAGAVALGTLVCPPVAAVAVPLAITAASLSGAGSATAFGASVAEICFLKKRVKKANEVLKEDKQYFKLMSKWFEHAKELTDAVERVIGFELMSEISEDMKKLHDELTDTENEHRVDVIRASVIKMCRSENVLVKFGVKVAPTIITFLFVRCMMNYNKLLVFSCVLTSIRTLIAGLALADTIVDLASVFNTVSVIENVGVNAVSGGNVGGRGGAVAGEGAAAVAQNCARVAVRGSLIAIGIALDLSVLALTAYDIHKGSVSEQSVKIAEAADMLEKELGVLITLRKNLEKV